MKTIGLIGGMSWESTVTYYQIINREISEKLGGFHSSKCILYSVDFHELKNNMSKGYWDENGKILSAAAQSLEKAGADFVLICTNTMHKLADQVKNNISIPLLHIAEVTAKELCKSHIATVALLGTKYTMEQDFYKDKLMEQGIRVLIPEPSEREFINDTIFDELCLGVIKDTSKQRMLDICNRLFDRGAQGILLGCTEIGLLLQQADTDIPLFDTTMIHAGAAARLSLEL